MKRTMTDMRNLAPLYFQNDKSILPPPPASLGPIELQSNSNLHGRGLIATRNIAAGECIMVLPSTLAVPVPDVYEAFVRHAQEDHDYHHGANGNGDNDKEDDDAHEPTQSIVEVLAERILMKRMKELLVSYHDHSIHTGIEMKLMALLLQVGDATLDTVVSHVVHELFDTNAMYDNLDAYILDILMEKSSLQQDCRSMLDLILVRLASGNSKNEAKDVNVNVNVNVDVDGSIVTDWITDDMMMQIMRRNVFGPEFHNHSNMEQTWKHKHQPPTNSPTQPYRTILGFYPLAAMINHSCLPNTVRVFVGNTMIVHTTTPLSQGDELVWSYTALHQPVHKRQSSLSHHFQFQCHCHRCHMEDQTTAILHTALGSKFWTNLEVLDARNLLSQGGVSGLSAHRLLKRLRAFHQRLDRTLEKEKISNEATRYVKAGYLSFYMNYLNLALQLSSTSTAGSGSSNMEDVYHQEILPLASYLHVTLLSCNNASTEHLSILHLCYDIISLLHTRQQPPSSKDDVTVDPISYRNKLKFWTDQLKQAVMIRYGRVGNDVQNVKMLMVHSKGILRSLDGLTRSEYKFI